MLKVKAVGGSVYSQQQLQMIMGEIQAAGQGGQGMTSGPSPKNMLPDGSQVGGRESNMMSPRPNGV